VRADRSTLRLRRTSFDYDNSVKRDRVFTYLVRNPSSVSKIGAARVKVVQEKRGGEGKERVGVSVDSGKQNAEGSAEIVRTAVPQSIAESRAH
jgi:hypothetical protein